MNMRDLFVAAAVAAFSLAGVASVNDSEAINVTLPSQYRTVWDQSLGVPGTGGTEVASPGARRGAGAVKSRHEVFGPFARNVFRRGADRG